MSLVNGLQSRTSRARLDEAKRNSLSRQIDMFRLAQRDCDMTQKRLAALTGFHPKTIANWAQGASCMDQWAFEMVAQYIPDHLTSLMVERGGKGVYSLDEGDDCFHDVARECHGFSGEYLEVGHEDHPQARIKLKERCRRLMASVARVVRRDR